MKCINPFNCDIVDEVIKESNMCPQVVTLKEQDHNVNYCCGFSSVSKNHEKCCNCKHFYFNTTSGKRVLKDVQRKNIYSKNS